MKINEEAGYQYSDHKIPENAISINGGQYVNSFSAKKISIASYFPKYCVILIIIISLIGLGVMVDQCFFQVSGYVYYSIDIKSLPNYPDFSYSAIGAIQGYTLPEAAIQFWHSKAYWNALVLGFMSVIFPFVFNIIIICAWLVPVNIMYRKHRTIFIFILSQIGKYQFVALTSSCIGGIVDTVINNSPTIDVWIKPAVSNQAGLFAMFNTLFLWFSVILLLVDQLRSYGLSPAIYDNKKWYCLAFEESKRNRSVFGIIIHSVYLTALICSVYLLLESLTFAQIKYTFSGLFNYGKTPAIYNSYWLGTHFYQYFYTKKFISEAITLLLLVNMIVIPISAQSLIVLVWIVPLKNKTFRHILRFVIGLQTINWLGLYYLSVVLIGIGNETKLYTAYLINVIELPELCGANSLIHNTFEDGCYASSAFYIPKGVMLITYTFIFSEFSFIYTLWVSNKYGINAMQFGQ